MKDTEQAIATYLKERNWDNLRPGDLAKSISIEAAELLELFQWINPEKDEVIENKELMAQVRKELADVLIYAIDLSVTLGMDTEEIIKEKLADIEKKYPAETMRAHAATDNTSKDSPYYHIKKQHRTRHS